MKYKVVLFLNRDITGDVLPIYYQEELQNAVQYLLTSDKDSFYQWLANNDLYLPKVNYNLFSLSNLYVPRLVVKGDRMKIETPRVQFWISFHHENGTFEYLKNCLQNKIVEIGDHKSSVSFQILSVDQMSDFEIQETMQYQSISPISVAAIDSSGEDQFLEPENPYFPQFIVEELIDRWERVNRQKYNGSREFSFKLLTPPKRKSTYTYGLGRYVKHLISYMIKFELTMDVQLQRLAYDLGIGDNISLGYGYIELLYRNKIANNQQ